MSPQGDTLEQRRTFEVGMRPESSALNITDRIDALATALRAAGISDEQASGLLASAATAAMHAVVLDAVLDELQAPAPAPAVSAEPAQPVRIAA
jgi:hypothetical protein